MPTLLLLLAACSDFGPGVPPDTDRQPDTDPVTDADADADADADTDADADADTDTDTDPLASARATCLDTLNQLRVGAGKAPLARWVSGEACADAAATSDQQSSTPHGAFGTCGENGQNECLGAGAAGVAGCVQSMWDERLLPGCAGCAACASAYTPTCPNCDFYGQTTGDVCGHYVNMNAEYFSEVACGFSAAGGWVVLNFR